MTAATEPLRPPKRLRDWVEALALFCVVALLALTMHLVTGVLDWRPETRPGVLLATAAVAVFIPALGEEAIFRGPVSRARPGLALLMLALFVAWHPAQLIIGLPSAQPLFADPRFLLIVAALGAACTVSRIRSGSIWPAVLIHWIVVVAWKGLTGGA